MHHNKLRNQKTTRGEIFIKCSIATVQKLENLLRQKVEILHIICHGLVEVERKTGTEEGVLCFEQLYNIGLMDKIYGRQIPDLIKMVPPKQRPKLVFVNACHSQLIGDAFLKSGVPFAVVIQSSEKIEDTAAQLFAERFYNSLFNGTTVRKSFQDAKDSLDRQNRPVNSNICCCFHPNMHDRECLWKDLVEQLGQQRCHDLYHVPACRCSKRHVHIHEKDCQWAIDTLFAINMHFRVYEGSEARRPTPQELEAYPHLMICCCSTPTKLIPHDQSQKFKFKWNKDADPETVLFPPVIIDLQSQVYDETPIELLNDFDKDEKLIGRNMEIFNMMNSIKDKIPRVLMVYGGVGSGRSGVVRKAVSYLVERNYYREGYYHFDLSNCSKTVDFEFAFLKHFRGSKVCDLQELLRIMSNKDIILVLDNCDLFIKTCLEEFMGEIHMILLTLKNAKIVIIVSDQIVKLHPGNLFNERRVCLEPLKKFAAADMFLMSIKEYLSDINIQDIWRLFEEEKLRSPKTILDMVHYIKTKYSACNKVTIEQLSTYVESIKEGRTTHEKFLEENLKGLKLDNQVYQLFLFLAQFPAGLTELDFAVMSSQVQPGNSHQSTLFLPQNWTDLVAKLLSQCGDSCLLFDTESLIKEGDYYYCLVDQSAGVKRIRVKKYILQYLAKFDEAKDPDLIFKAIAYLSNYCSLLIRIVRQKYYYHEHLIEYSSVSQTGIFQFEKSSRYYQFYDQDDYYPDMNVNLTKSISRGQILDSEIKALFANNEQLSSVDPLKLILQHQDNFMQIYRNDYAGYYNDLVSEKKKLFKHYHHSLMLNIPSLIKLAKDQVNRNFLKYCIDESSKRLKLLEPGRNSKTINMYLLKLDYMRLVYELNNSPLKDITAYRVHFDSMRWKIVWDKQMEISKVEELEYRFLKIYIHFENLKQNGRAENYVHVIKQNSKFKSIQEQVDKNELGTRILIAKKNLLLANAYFWILEKIDKDKGNKSFQQFRNSYDFAKKSRLMSEAIETFREAKLKLLEVDALIAMVKTKLALFKKKSSTDVSEFFLVRKSYLQPCRQLLASEVLHINSRDRQNILTELEQKLNKKIWLKIKNLLVFMKASPLVSEEGDSMPYNTVRRSHNFKFQVESTLNVEEYPQKNWRQKEVSVRFEILTKKKLVDVVSQGCSVLLLRLNAQVEGTRVSLKLENQMIPVEEKVDAELLFKQMNWKSVSIIVICGQNANAVAEKLRSIDEPPTVICVDFMTGSLIENQESFFDTAYNQNSVRSLQRIASNQFISTLCENIVYGKPKKANDLSQTVRSTLASTVLYMVGFSKTTNNQEKLKRMLQITVTAGHDNQELQFDFGHYHDVSSQKSTLHNLKRNPITFVGREKVFLAVIKNLLQNQEECEPAYINIHGIKTCGKSAFVHELAEMLLERGHFKSGIYLMSGWEIENIHKGNIFEYLQRNKNDIFPPSYLGESDDSVDFTKMLIIIDDYHALKDRSHYLESFFNSVYEKRINLILTSNDKLQNTMVPGWTRHTINYYEIKRLTEEEAEILVFSYVPLYDFDQYREQFRLLFFNLRKKHSSLMPKVLIEEFKRLWVMANQKSSALKYANYRDHVELSRREGRPQDDSLKKNNKKLAFLEPEDRKIGIYNGNPLFRGKLPKVQNYNKL